ncbi:MAG: serine hydrolase [Acidimicrobiales bacterium]
MIDTLDKSWPGSPAFVVLRARHGTLERLVEVGDLDEIRAWASVSKMAVALAFGVENDWDLHHYDDVLGPSGATLANLLSHSSGLGLELGDPVVAPGTKRIYSNYGVDYAVGTVVGENTAANWLADRVFSPLGMNDSRLEGRPAAGVVGSTNDLARLAEAWLLCDGLARTTRDRIIRPYLADLTGIVPGFGRFSPCPWGLGPEVRGEKQHWMGEWPASSFGHFGQSGALMLVNCDEQIAVVATSTEPFGAWATQLWPTWMSAQRSRALAT